MKESETNQPLKLRWPPLIRARPLTSDEEEKAFQLWYRDYNFKELDAQINLYNNAKMKSFIKGTESWIERTRKALFLSTYTAAKKMNVQYATFANYEKREKDGSITIGKLAEVAESLECELVYAIRPKTLQTFSKILWDKMREPILYDAWIRTCDQKQRARAAAAIARKFCTQADFKKKYGWSQRLNS